MATTREVGDSEVSDDSISLTSTVASDMKEDYEVESILAERRNPMGIMEYLTAWKDYPMTAYDWLPRENFNECDTDGDVFSEWTNTKKRVANGLEKPFDVKAWRKKCKAIGKETVLRRERRRIKKLRLIKQTECAQRIGRQDAKIESSGSKSAPKRSDKRIKRRSVHQDRSPSSSISSLPSSPSSEDSDKPLSSRQKSEIFAPDPKWTQAETIALEEGLQILKGPRWRELLSLFGRNGTRSQVLKDKVPRDLYDKAKSVRQEFVDSGREPPEYLKPFSKPNSSKGSRTSTPNIYSDSRGQSRAVSKQSSRSTSVDSMMAELHEKQQIWEAKNRENGRPQQNTKAKEIINPASGRKEDLNTAPKMSGDKLKAHQASQVPARKAGKAVPNETPNEIKPHPKKGALHTKKTTEIQEGINSHSHRGRQPEDRPRPKEPSQISAIPQVERQLESQDPNTKKIADYASNSATQSAISYTFAPEDNETMRRETARTTWSGTARAQTARPSVSNPSRRGSAASGPARPSSSKMKPKTGQIGPKKPIVTGDVTAAWNAEPKRRMSNNWATSNADLAAGQPTKRNYKLSVQNRIFKSRREGRAPDPNRLLFIDPKTGKAPTTVSAPSAAAMLSKTPLQLHQEELAAKEAEERKAQDVEDAVLISTSEPDPPPQDTDQNKGIRIEEQKALETGRSLTNASATALRPTTGDMTDGPAPIETLSSPPLTSPSPSHSSNVILEPRTETSRMATISLQDYTQRLKPSTHHMSETIDESYRPGLPDDPSKFTLRNYPSREHKTEISSKVDSNLVMGEINLGENDQESIAVRFVGFGFEVKKLLLTIKTFPRTRTTPFVFKMVCLASEYKAYFPAEVSDYLGSGSIISRHSSESAVENIVETLANNLQGGLFFAQQYTMLMYPAGASVWAFLDKDLPAVHPGTALRFVIRKPLPPVTPDVHGLVSNRLTKAGPERYAEIKTKLQKYPIQAEDKNINIVFRDMFEIEFGRLVAQNGPQQHPPTNIFFLCFIPQGCEIYEPDSAKRSALRMRTSEEHDLFIKFLQANGAEEIYSMQAIGSQEVDDNSAWDYFCKNVKSGTIVFHDAFIRYDLVPRLAKHLLHGSVNVWKTSLSPMLPGEKHPHLVRLFPHGGVLLLTESLILYQPRETLRILMWFRRVHVPGKAPGTWKLAVRPRIREWLLDIIEAYSDSGKEIFGCSIQLFADIYTEIYWLLRTPDTGDNGLMCHEWDYETPTDEAPLVSSASLRALQSRREWKGEGADTEPDDDHIRENDDILAQWFSEWAIVNLANFRKYHIILGYAKDHPFTPLAISAYEKGWGHVEVMTFEEALARHKVTAQSKLDQMEVERRKRLKEHLPAKKAAAQRARREEREAAKSSLEIRMKVYRDVGGTEEEVMRAGRQLLSDWNGSEKEMEECRVDMDRVFVDRWWEAPVTDGDVDMNTDELDRTEVPDKDHDAQTALPSTLEHRADRNARSSREASAAGIDGVERMDVSG